MAPHFRQTEFPESHPPEKPLIESENPERGDPWKELPDDSGQNPCWDMLPDDSGKEMAKRLKDNDTQLPQEKEAKPVKASSGLFLKGDIRLPRSNGRWEGEPGDSPWHPDPDFTPPEKSKNPDKPYSNPNQLPWKELLEKYGISEIVFKNGFPDFSKISRGTVKIEGFETGGEVAKRHNFEKAADKLAEEKGCTKKEVKQWMLDNNYTWHECEDKETMQKVPNEIHANIPHNGGRSQGEEGNPI